MKQIEKINIELQLIQNGMRIISNLTNDFHESESNSEIVKKLQNDTMDLFNPICNRNGFNICYNSYNYDCKTCCT